MADVCAVGRNGILLYSSTIMRVRCCVLLAFNDFRIQIAVVLCVPVPIDCMATRIADGDRAAYLDVFTKVCTRFRFICANRIVFSTDTITRLARTKAQYFTPRSRRRNRRQRFVGVEIIRKTHFHVDAPIAGRVNHTRTHSDRARAFCHLQRACVRARDRTGRVSVRVTRASALTPRPFITATRGDGGDLASSVSVL